jgi:hypothetical protein
MQYYPIGRNQQIAGVLVPLMIGGWKYLDWRKKQGNTAPLLHSPYGESHFKIGGGEGANVVLDYAELPDGNFVIEMIAPESMKFHCEDSYSTFLRDDLMAAVHYKVTKIIDRLDEVGIKHDSDLHRVDAWYFMRAIGKEAKATVYLSMDDHTLRFG